LKSAFSTPGLSKGGRDMLDSVFHPNVKGLDESLQYIDREDVIPLAIVCARADRNGLHPIILDCSSCQDDEDVRRAMLNSVMLAMAAKVRG
jgi:hypothetical protein